MIRKKTWTPLGERSYLDLEKNKNERKWTWPRFIKTRKLTIFFFIKKRKTKPTEGVIWNKTALFLKNLVSFTWYPSQAEELRV